MKLNPEKENRQNVLMLILFELSSISEDPALRDAAILLAQKKSHYD